MTRENDRLAWSLNRTFVIASNTFREAVRMRLFLAMTGLAICALASSFLFREFNFGSSELKFIADFGFGGMTLFGSALAIIVTAQLFLGEIEHRTAMTLLAKPVFRSEFVLGKFLGVWVTVACFIGMLTLCLVLALWMRESSIRLEYPEGFEQGQRLVQYGGIIWFSLAQVFRIGILCALVILFSTYATSSLFAMVMGVLVWIVGQLQHIAIEARGVVDSLVLKGIYSAVGFALPNFHLYDVGEGLAMGEVLPISLVGKLLLYGALYSAFYLAVATASFNRREL
ncbi:MAG TPA: ABC transporter permease [Opitutae bacterium]|nr:ABC transporter permease [Opitutaceae bacterium]HCR29822.1 ABC transporter permease [Opitutae bacterium]